MPSIWSWFSASSSKPKSRRVVDAEACFSNEELLAIRHQYEQALQAQGGPPGQGLQQHTFLYLLCGWPQSGPNAPGPPSSTPKPPAAGHALLGQALFSVVSGMASRAGGACATVGSSDNVHKQPQQHDVSVEDVILSKAMCERMITDDSIAIAFSILCAIPQVTTITATSRSPVQDATVSSGALKCCLSAAVDLLAALGNLPSSYGASYRQAGTAGTDVWVDAMVQGVLWSAAGPAADAPAPHLDATGYTRCARACPVIHVLLTGLLSGIGRGGASKAAVAAAPPMLPVCPELILSGPSPPPSNGARPSAPASASQGQAQDAPLPSWLLLQPIVAMMLSHGIPPAQRGPWRLIFNSDKDGKSFNTLVGRLSAVQGATLILVREAGEGGHTVAGYAPLPWRKTGSFYGDHSTWVAGLLPRFQVFPATGANTNFQWCGQGFSQLVNGIGFGGAQGNISAFALLVDATLDNGQSRPIATFGSPSLTHNQVFQVDAVECWLVQQPDEGADGGTHGGTSVLDKTAHAADRIIMGLAGKEVNNSAGLRFEEPIE